eukprot:4501336-Pyramimonas_sp.AAC.1
MLHWGTGCGPALASPTRRSEEVGKNIAVAACEWDGSVCRIWRVALAAPVRWGGSALSSSSWRAPPRPSGSRRLLQSCREG